MMDTVAHKLAQWLIGHDDRLRRFREPIPVTTVGAELHEAPEHIQQVLERDAPPLFHCWAHTHAGQISRSKPYCLRLNGAATVGLDWEDSIIGAAEAVFQRMQYQTKREIGTAAHIDALINFPDLAQLTSGINQRDLWALRKAGNTLDLYIIEAKGKEAYPFDYYSFAETLSQLFMVPASPLTTLLGSKKGPSHGLCWQFAEQLYAAWSRAGLTPTVTVAMLLPTWSPDVIWNGSKIRHIPTSYYARPQIDFQQFLETGKTLTTSGKYQYQRTFGALLDGLESTYHLRALHQAQYGLRFRLLTVGGSAGSQAYIFNGL